MGALTDSRKRLSADHRLLPSFPPSPPPTSKKPKLAPLPSLPSLLPTSPAPPPHPSSTHLPASPSSSPGPSSSTYTTTASTSSSFLHRRRLPPPPPLPRPIHGPQRVLRAFRLGPTRPHSSSSWYSPSPPPQSLGLDQYVELVNSVSHPPPPTPSTDVLRGAEATAEVVTVDDGEDRKEEREEQQEDEEEVKGTVVVRRVPLYRELYEASRRKRDAKLRTIEFEVRLAEKGRLGLERLGEVLPQTTPKKELAFLLVWHGVLVWCPRMASSYGVPEASKASLRRQGGALAPRLALTP